MKTKPTLTLITLAAALTACGGSTLEFFPDYSDDVPPTVTGKANNTILFSNATTIYPVIPATITLSGTDLKSEPVTLFYTTSGSYTTYTNTTPLIITDKAWNLTVYGKDAIGNASTPYTVKFTK